MNILIPFRVDKVAHTLTKVTTITFGFHHYIVFVVQLCGNHVFVIPLFVLWKLYKLFNDTLLDETACAGKK
jgi:hypothetical protein